MPESLDQLPDKDTHQRIERSGILQALLNALPVGALIANESRQVLFANRHLNNLVGNDQLAPALLPGALLSCEHASDNPAGCGTTEACTYCGLNQSLKASQAGIEDERECRITRMTASGPQALDLRVYTTAFPVLGDSVYLVVVIDISGEKRRQVLEQLFFHDLSNTAYLIDGLVQLMGDSRPTVHEGAGELINLLGTASSRLMDEIEAQRQLLAAETGELTLEPRPIDTRNLIESVLGLFRGYQLDTGNQLRLDESAASVVINSDPALLGRVMANMVKNALEASRPGEPVTIGCHRMPAEVQFWVHNVAPMPPAAQAQVFQRNFTTKGPGRGLGTYSMRLLAERYLGGRVTFSSNAVAGTTFTASFPVPAAPLPEKPT